MLRLFCILCSPKAKSGNDDDDDEMHHLLTCYALPQVKKRFGFPKEYREQQQVASFLRSHHKIRQQPYIVVTRTKISGEEVTTKVLPPASS